MSSHACHYCILIYVAAISDQSVWHLWQSCCHKRPRDRKYGNGGLSEFPEFLVYSHYGNIMTQVVNITWKCCLKYGIDDYVLTLHTIVHYSCIHVYSAGRILQNIITICIAMTILALFLLLYFGSPLSYFNHQQSWVFYSPSLPDYVSHFSGREKEISDIVHWLDPQNTDVRIVSIVGPPGFGKSSLAIQVGHEMIDRGVVVNYVNLDEVTVEDLPGKIVANAGVTTKDGSFERLHKWVRNDIHFPVLLILDNCDDVIYKQEDELLKFLQILRRSAAMNVIKFLLTTKNKINIVDDFEEYPLEEISFEASCKLLRGVAKREVDEQSCKAITQQTGHVPLALKVVGAILRTRTRNISEVVEKLQSQLLQTLNPTDMDKRVNVSLTVSYSYLSERQKKLGQHLSLFPGSFAGKDACSILNDTLDSDYQTIDLEINVLEQKSLLQSFGKGRYQFHRIIRIFFVANYNNSEHRNRFWKKFRLHYADLLFNVSSEFRKDYKSALHTLDIEKHNLYYMLSDIQEICLMDSEVSLRVFETVNTALNTRFLNRRFSVNELIKLIITIRRCLEDILQNYFDITFVTHIQIQFMGQVRRIMNILAALSAEHYILDGSAASLEFVKALVERLEGIIRVPGAVIIYYNLATHYHSVGDLDKEKRCYERIILLANATLGSCSYGFCDYHELSWAYYYLKKFKIAAYFAELDLNYNQNSMSPFVLIKTLHLLHNCQERVGNRTEATGTFNAILQVLPSLNDTNLPEVYSNLKDLSNIALFLRYNERTEEARYVERKLILAIKEMNATDTRLESTFALKAGELAQRLYKVEEYSEAIDMGECALSYFNKISDVGSKIKILIVLGQSNYYIGNANASKEHFKEAIKCSLSDLHLYSYEASTACRFIITYTHEMHYDCMNILWTGFQQSGYAILRFVVSDTLPADLSNFTLEENEITSTDISLNSKHLEFFPPELTIPVMSF